MGVVRYWVMGLPMFSRPLDTEAQLLLKEVRVSLALVHTGCAFCSTVVVP